MVFKRFFFLFNFLFLISLTMSYSCDTYCGYQEIKFPFQLENQPGRCGYPGFNLSCKNKTDTIITIPYSGNFSVEMIDYYGQNIAVRDPDGCLAKRLLQGFDPYGTPFHQVYLQNFSLLNCSSNIPIPELHSNITTIPCLSTENNYAVAIPADRPHLSISFSSCLEIATVSLPLLEKWEYLSDRIWLTWKEPDCKRCLRSEGVCYKKGFGVGCSVDLHPGRKHGQRHTIEVQHDTTLMVIAWQSSQNKDTGSSRMGKYFMIFAALTLVFLVVLVICISCVKHCVKKWRGSDINTEISNGSTIQQLNASKKGGLDQRAIEMYPTTLAGGSRELPKPSDTTCSICLFEYQAKETLKTLPSCMHYFHAKCIDEWLKRSATCPLCRE